MKRPPPRRELSPEALAGIENMRAPANVKVEYLLLALGAKPAVWQDIQTPAYMDTWQYEPPPTMPDDIVEEHLQVARNAGIAVIQGSQNTVTKIGGKHATALELFLGSSQENAERLRDAALADSPDDRSPTDDRSLGIALGYPETAVDAYTNQRPTISPNQVPGIAPEVAAFAGFMLSGEHYQEELETARRWAEAVKTVSPKIYNERLLQAGVQPVRN